MSVDRAFKILPRANVGCPRFSFVRNDAGSTVVLFASVLAVLGISGGVAVDAGRAYSAKSRLQAALDAAVLSAVPLERSQREAQAKAVFAEQASVVSLNTQPRWNSNANTFSGRAVTQLPTAMLKLIGINTIDIDVSSKAAVQVPQMPDTITITLDSAKGWFWKRVSIWAHLPGETSDRQVAALEYQATTLFNEGSGTVSGPLGQAISLPRGYDHVYLKMEVSPDGCGPTAVPRYPEAIQYSDTRYWSPYECVSSGQTSKSIIFEKRTDDALMAHHLFVDGRQLPAGSAHILTMLPCGTSVTHAWEDTAYYDPNDPEIVGAWRTQDIVFTVDTTCRENPSYAGGAYLTD